MTSVSVAPHRFFTIDQSPRWLITNSKRGERNWNLRLVRNDQPVPSIIIRPYYTFMPKSGDLWVGVMMVVTGLYTLAWMPTLKKRLAKRQELGERTGDQVRSELKKMKLVIICSLVVGGGLICIYAFNLSDPGRWKSRSELEHQGESRRNAKEAVIICLT